MPDELVPLPELDERGRAVFAHDGRPYAVFTLLGEEGAGEVVVTDGACPHRGGPVGLGLQRDGAVVCPWHWYTFDLATGRCLTAAERPLARYPVEHVGGRLHARLRPVPRPSWSALLRAHAREGRPPPTSQDAGA
jgi:nitrite reductase (NADH) small subunit